MISQASEQTMVWESKLLEVRRYVAAQMKDLPYHNFIHVIDVRNASRTLARLENLSPKDDFLLETAAYLHDIVYDLGAKNNEERSAEMAHALLTALRYTSGEIEQVKQLILATKVPTHPKTKLEEIICDADVDNLGRDDFFEKSDAVRREFGIEEKKIWYVNALKFLENHQYYTHSARNLRQEGKEKNMKALRSLIEL